MNYLDLVNKVLVRLRENTVTSATFNNTPYVRMIGAAVNDAKDNVEQAWKWSQLRGTVPVTVTQGDTDIELLNSADRVYQVGSILNTNQGNYLRWVTEPWLRVRYQNNTNDPVAQNVPSFYGFGYNNASTGNQTLTLYPPANDTYTLNVNYWSQQDQLVEWDDNLQVPALPVYLLATALAARERGEVGGAPTSELFVLADKALSDAIAYDSARFPEEMDWFTGQNVAQTNVRQY